MIKFGSSSAGAGSTTGAGVAFSSTFSSAGGVSSFGSAAGSSSTATTASSSLPSTTSAGASSAGVSSATAGSFDSLDFAFVTWGEKMNSLRAEEGVTSPDLGVSTTSRDSVFSCSAAAAAAAGSVTIEGSVATLGTGSEAATSSAGGAVVVSATMVDN